jgi:hypothetical protein
MFKRTNLLSAFAAGLCFMGAINNPDHTFLMTAFIVLGIFNGINALHVPESKTKPK